MAKSLWYSLFIGFVLLIALIGYSGFVWYLQLDFAESSLLILAVMAGIASFFTPCSFPLLTALLARSIHTNEQSNPLRRALAYGLFLALGTSAFLFLVGIGLAFGAQTLFGQITFTSVQGRLLRLVVGSVLILLGTIQLEWLSVPFGKVTSLLSPLQKLQISLRDNYPSLGFFIFGFSYVLAGFG